ncbi:MAG: hypothetical protein AB2604_01830 [Candidatus Thiodiazotropha taylori]
MFDLDSSARRKSGNTIKFKPYVKPSRQLRIINKALTMELLNSGMFGHIDHPAKVQSNCTVSNIRAQNSSGDTDSAVVPNNFAQGGVPDVTVDYESFMVMLEVSAKYQRSLEDFVKQLNGALKHARELRDQKYGQPIYCVTINERTLEHVPNKEALEEVLKDIQPSEEIYLTVVSIEEFASLGHAMAGDYKNEAASVSAADLLTVLKATAEKGVNGNFHRLFEEHLAGLKSRAGNPNQVFW